MFLLHSSLFESLVPCRLLVRNVMQRLYDRVGSLGQGQDGQVTSAIKHVVVKWSPFVAGDNVLLLLGWGRGFEVLDFGLWVLLSVIERSCTLRLQVFYYQNSASVVVSEFNRQASMHILFPFGARCTEDLN